MVKEVVRSSFGAIVYDSLPCLYVPIGFSAGLEDRDTHLIRFTWRDYDPRIGRFMSLDPANDTRGDGDLYDYCVDDPVNRQDVSGLAWDESKHPRDADGQFANAWGSIPSYSTEVQGLRAPVYRGVYRGNAMSAREELKRSAISRNGMMRREEILPRDAALPKWDLDAAIAHLQTQSHKDSTGDCSIYVRQAIEAGGIRMNKSLNSGGGGAYGFGPILWDAGFRTVSSGEEPQNGDVAIFQPVKGHPNGHIAMFDGNIWISDFRQKDVYGGSGYRKGPEPYVLYRRP